MTQTKRIQLQSLTQTCMACPSQWEGRTTDGQYVYIRFRWGCLSISVDPVHEQIFLDGKFQAGEQVSDGLDGFMDEEQMLTTARERLGVDLVLETQKGNAE